MTQLIYLDIRKLIFKYSLHWVKDRARGISGNRNVNTKWLAGHLKQQHRGVPAGLCGTLAGHVLKHRLIDIVINNPGVMVQTGKAGDGFEMQFELNHLGEVIS